ncbi:DEAD/DEAH box helicase family protein [Patulibacter brassicae]|uniref:DEAD/DEAH box helicase family protein n=1 Tax=Patulibacter brassicae TaxID=1705717 RepID=A0ABU4VLW5_9ACTN|nr:DEAD/DEAH box helicase family protein [Patulibacter brassicae]MDX8152089.1 DEAD/DEAH box helicase family protein [Patulibacter brassicae]
MTRTWAGPDSEVGAAVTRFSASCLDTYRVDARRVVEDANIERIATEGGYARRQLFELIQNGADELIDRRGRIRVVVTDHALYCANEGRPVSEQGVGAILGSHNSPKTGVEIGRFGLGFKSVLGVSRTPAVYSTSGSFGFDADRNLDAVRRIVPDADRAAVLRMAEPIDPAAAAADDPVLAELMDDADTVIVMPLDTGPTAWLPSTFRTFPAQFLLFSSHVEQLTLEDRTGEGYLRNILLDEEGDGVWVLHDTGTEDKTSRWKLFGVHHSLSRAVRRDGGTMAERPVIPIHWAVPISRAEPGQLWAFFPTQVETTLSGIINAPWKLDESRTTLVPGEFNAELLSAAVDVVIENLAEVARTDDPGFMLELLPGRGKELKGWADEILSDLVYKRAADADSLPDQTGRLQHPSTLRLLPEDVGVGAAECWSEQPTRPVAWVHPSAVRNATRRSRAVRLIEAVDGRQEPVDDWLEALIGRRKIEGSAAALRVATALVFSEADAGMRKAKMILTADGRLVPPTRGLIFRPAAVDVDVDVPLVASELLEEEGVPEALDALKVQQVSAATVLDALVDRAVSGSDASRDWNWGEAWKLADRVTGQELRDILIGRHSLVATDVYVRTMSGRMARLADVLLPGSLLSPEDFKATHRGLLVDTVRHRLHLDVLRELGATDRPVRDAGSTDEPWLAEYRRQLVKAAIDEARTHGARVKPEHFELIPRSSWPGPATPLDGLSGGPAAKYARELLAACDDLEPWVLRRTKGRVTDSSVEHPLLWRIRQVGVLPTDKGVRPIADCVTDLLKPMAPLLPVVDLPRPACRALGLPDTMAGLDDRRLAIACDAVGDLEREDQIGAAYVALQPALGTPPERIRAVVRRDVVWATPADVCVTSDLADLKVLRGTGVPFIRVAAEEQAERLITAWGLRRISDLVGSRIVAQADGDREKAIDRYPLLRFMLPPVVERVELMPCSEIHREMFTDEGSMSEPLDFELRDDILYYDSRLDDVTLLRRLAERLGVPLARDDARNVIDNAQAEEVQALLAEVRSATDDATRLLSLIGVDELRSRVPDVLIEAVEESEGELSDLDVAELALTVFGVETLKVFSDSMEKRGLAPPSEWVGRRTTVKFVTEDLGFPRKYAGFAGVKLVDTLDVPGPTTLPKLHDFQDRAAAGIRSLLVDDGDRRGLLSLPTGAGKTRVTVEALIRAVAAGELESPILWIAQTQELCEQAVQSWAEVWRAVGPARSLKISRLWGSYSAQAREDGGIQVVVATIAKLGASCFGKPAYKWLSRPGVVIVDEAHVSTTTSYTELLKWTGIDRGTDHAPLIGLSATPYRGFNSVETDSLAGRYGIRRLDEGVFDEAEGASISLLQDKGILARVDHQVLEGSEQVPLTSAEKEHIQKYRSLPPSVLNKIGRDLDRTNRLVKSVTELPADWPVLMFAASVAHAETLAALVARKGRSAAAISGDTPDPVRRHLIGEFRAGRLQTLTNYGVLTEGFDAPSIRALYIARPTYSPNRYLQMIGRGLRGPANGGKPVCQVIDVADNVVAFGLRLAFREFEQAWKQS